ncbi:relaxase/mobilization nuclease domain-containing protein [Echinicola marina]|uniref:Relaxase/mobilization nuclease n=1 Tax=Echinicola vietnamensis (strain DSM 17526 / LMG 23754 / KMM 6221) TaxID=926556 RepID=L0FRX1_ECHVK|nr:MULTISPECIES: relaxase/mobilization nuclease domain-containing protein [Echinicola]AGA76679.1 relaxase/mobilization nuclease [Echinicola vietnamensis DSM 17526]UCS93820.1 relaxase/mobilization nuclease domain-containing protein [Echinicola marina]
MIAKQSIGKNFMGALDYNLKKMLTSDESKRAEVLETNFTSLDREMVKKEVELMKSMNPRLKRNTYHVSLSFGKEEKISNDKMLAIGNEYLKGMGFDDNAYFIFRHHDADHPHCHLLALRNRFDGTVVSDSNNYRRSESLVRKLEKKYGLQQVKSSKEAKVKAPNKDEIEMVMRTGKPSKKMVLQQIISEALKRTNTIEDFIHQVEASGANLLFNQASTGRVSGVAYCYDGFKAKGQSLGNQFKWKNIANTLHYEQTRDRQAIGQANARTTSKYPRGLSGNDEKTTRVHGVHSQDAGQSPAHQQKAGQTERSDRDQLSVRDQNEFQTRGDKDGASIPARTATKDRKEIYLSHQIVGGTIDILDLLLRPVPDTGEVGQIPKKKKKRRKKGRSI